MLGLRHFCIGLIFVTLDVMMLLSTFLAWASLGWDARIVLNLSLFSEFRGIFLRVRNSAKLLFGEREFKFLLGSITATGSTRLSSLFLMRVEFNPNMLSLSKMLYDGDVIRSGRCLTDDRWSSGSLKEFDIFDGERPCRYLSLYILRWVRSGSSFSYLTYGFCY